MRALAFAAALLASGCIDDLTSPSLVERPRVLAGRASVVGNPAQVFPAPGETLSIEWLVSAPEATPPAGWSMLACPGEVAPTGGRFCTGAPIGIFAMPQSTDPIRFEVQVPADIAASEILIRGNVCFESDPNLDPMTVLERPCAVADAMVERLVFGIPIARDGRTNRNPSIPPILRIEDELWSAPFGEPIVEGCAAQTGPALPAVSAGGGPIVLGIDPDPADLETFLDGDATRTETLVYSHAATSGSFARFFSSVSDASARVRVDWTPPAADVVPEGGLLVRFYFIVRDERAGTNWTDRALCVVK
jgi:hypothetical protein